MLDFFKYLSQLLDEIDFILKVHCGFSLEEIKVVTWEEVELYYKKWYDYEMNQRITQMAIAGIEYNDSNKCKTSFYSDYIKEASNNKVELSLRDEYKKRLGIRETVTTPKFLFEKVK